MMHPADHLRRIGWSAAELARRTGYTDRTIRRWIAGDTSPPADLLAWLSRLAAAVKSLPPPPRADAEVRTCPDKAGLCGP